MVEAFLKVLPDLGPTIVAVLVFGYIVKYFVDFIKELNTKHEAAIRERELALRALEKEVRENLISVIAESTQAVKETRKVMIRFLSNVKPYEQK